MFSRRMIGNAGIVEPEQFDEDAAVGPLTDATAESQDAETPLVAEESTQTPWVQLGFGSARELADAFRNINSLRGRQANELGELRAENQQLRALIGEGGVAGGPAPDVAVILAELDGRFLSQLDYFAAALAQAVEGRVGPLEAKFDALLERFTSDTRPQRERLDA